MEKACKLYLLHSFLSTLEVQTLIIMNTSINKSILSSFQLENILEGKKHIRHLYNLNSNFSAQINQSWVI